MEIFTGDRMLVSWKQWSELQCRPTSACRCNCKHQQF